MLKRIKDGLSVLLARSPVSAVMRIVKRDHLMEYYDDLATPSEHMREIARKRIGLMSEMPHVRR